MFLAAQVEGKTKSRDSATAIAEYDEDDVVCAEGLCAIADYDEAPATGAEYWVSCHPPCACQIKQNSTQPFLPTLDASAV